MTAIVVHGGAGTVEPVRHARLRAGCAAAAAAGDAILAVGGPALDAVVAAVRVLEDDPEYNAGTGSVLTRDGTVETDAAVMDGASRRIGAVAAVPELGTAIAVARAVLDDGEHVLLAGPAVWQFAAAHGFAPAAPGALVTERQRARLAAVLARRGPPAHGGHGGTVGAVARDRDGRFAAATSTGGIVGKRAGRVGDSPLAGAGTWADDACAVSATGDGEAIVRVALGHAVAAAVARGASIDGAARAALAELARVTGGSAGVIAVDRDAIVAIQLAPVMPCASIVRRGDAVARSDGLGAPAIVAAR